MVGEAGHSLPAFLSFLLSFPINVFVGFPELTIEGTSCRLAGQWWRLTGIQLAVEVVGGKPHHQRTEQRDFLPLSLSGICECVQMDRVCVCVLVCCQWHCENKQPGSYLFLSFNMTGWETHRLLDPLSCIQPFTTAATSPAWNLTPSLGVSDSGLGKEIPPWLAESSWMAAWLPVWLFGSLSESPTDYLFDSLPVCCLLIITSSSSFFFFLSCSTLLLFCCSETVCCKILL